MDWCFCFVCPAKELSSSSRASRVSFQLACGILSQPEREDNKGGATCRRVSNRISVCDNLIYRVIPRNVTIVGGCNSSSIKARIMYNMSNEPQDWEICCVNFSMLRIIICIGEVWLIEPNFLLLFLVKWKVIKCKRYFESWRNHLHFSCINFSTSNMSAYYLSLVKKPNFQPLG